MSPFTLNPQHNSIHEGIDCCHLLIVTVWQISPNQHYGPTVQASGSAQSQNVVLSSSFTVLTFLFYRRELKAGHEDISFLMSHSKTVTESGI